MEAKRNILKATKFPKTALAFYIKQFCKQRDSSMTKCQNHLIRAIESWLSLSELEKQQVTTIYKESEQKFKLKYFDQLKNAEPFMKVKDTRLKNVDLSSSNLIIQIPDEPVPIDEERSQTEAEHLENKEQITLGCEEELETNNEPQQDQEEHNETVVEPMDTNEQTSRIFLLEPSPPTLRTGKDLFHILNSKDDADGANNLSWTSLPQLERNQYSRAVTLLKKDYITKYTFYLESLSPIELFSYYNKTFSSDYYDYFI